MPVRKITFTQGEYYHVYNRGLQKQTIFHSTYDYIRFMETLIHIKTQKFPSIKILAWALMPNHFHILISDSDSGVPGTPESISRFFYLLQMSYARYYSVKYKEDGQTPSPLFQGRFQAKHIKDDSYLLQLLHYIHNQPKHHEITADNFDWPYTSLHDYWYQKKVGLQITDINSSVLDVLEYQDLFRGYIQRDEEEFD